MPTTEKNGIKKRYLITKGEWPESAGGGKATTKEKIIFLIIAVILIILLKMLFDYL